MKSILVPEKHKKGQMEKDSAIELPDIPSLCPATPFPQFSDHRRLIFAQSHANQQHSKAHQPSHYPPHTPYR